MQLIWIFANYLKKKTIQNKIEKIFMATDLVKTLLNIEL